MRKTSNESTIDAMDAAAAAVVAAAAAFIQIPERVENSDTAEMDHL